MSSVCVIGGEGFLGSYMCRSLIYSGHDVTIFDQEDRSRLEGVTKFVAGDVRDQDAILEAISGCDAVYHFAAIADIKECLEQPLLSAEVNIMGTLQVLEACRKLNIARFIFASSVYAQSREGGFYRCSKLASEAYVREYHRRFGLNFTILRYGSLYGPQSGIENGLYQIVLKALTQGRLVYDGAKGTVREYIHVHDAARASVDMLKPDFENKTIVLSGSQSYSMEDVLKMISEIIGIHEEPSFTNNEHVGHYVKTPYADIVEPTLKYQPNLQIDFGQGLLDLVKYVRTQNS